MNSTQIFARQIRELVVRPALTWMGLLSQAAENLVVGTALVETNLAAIAQIGGGPALSLWQIEPATHDDLWRWLNVPARYSLASKLAMMIPEHGVGRSIERLPGDLYYAAAVCRLLYYRAPAALPGADDVEGLGAYWKTYYNTMLGAGNPATFVARYKASA